VGHPAFPIDVIRRLPVFTAARILIQLERELSGAAGDVDLWRDCYTLRGRRQANDKMRTLDQNRSRIAQIPESARVDGISWIGQGNQQANSGQAGEKMQASGQQERVRTACGGDTFDQDNGSERAALFNVDGRDRGRTLAPGSIRDPQTGLLTRGDRRTGALDRGEWKSPAGSQPELRGARIDVDAGSAFADADRRGPRDGGGASF
jgi:hypothetical protein